MGCLFTFSIESFRAQKVLISMKYNLSISYFVTFAFEDIIKKPGTSLVAHVKELPRNAEDAGSILGQGTKIPLSTKQLSLNATTTESMHQTR